VAALSVLTISCSTAPGTLPGSAPPPPTVVDAAATAPEAAADPVPDPPTTTTTVASMALPDVTAAPLDADRLRSLLPAAVPDAIGGPDPAGRSNAALRVGSTPDTADEAADVERFGRIGGVAASYRQTDGTAHVWIDLLPDAAAAHGYLLDVAGDVAKGVGPLRLPAVAPNSVDDYPVDGIGEEAIGLILGHADEDTETAVLFRLGRLVAMVSLVRAGGDHRVATGYLAGETAEGMVAALVSGVAAPAIAGPEETPESHRFTTSLTASGEGGTLLITAVGSRTGDATACRVTAEWPDGMVDREFRRVGGRLWGRESGGDWSAVGEGNTLDRTLLLWCPAWPLHPRAAGLVGLLEGDAARMATAAGDLLGYRGDQDDLAEALGVPMRAVIVDVFTAWVTHDGRHLIEVNLSVEGPAAALAPLLGAWPAPGDTVELGLRHRVEDLGADLPAILPPS
jgi:hypothetical protein